MSDAAEFFFYLALIVALYFGSGALGAWMFTRKGVRWFFLYMAALPVIGGLVWGWSLGETYPIGMKVEIGFWIALISLIGFVLPQCVTSRSKRPAAVVFGIVLSGLLSIATSLYVYGAMAFRGV